MKALLLTALLAVPASAAKAPDLVLPVLLQAPASKLGGLAELKGKVVFVEFWATWCAPCVAGFPRTNRMIDALKGEPVVFIAVTDEEPKKIEAFLKRREFKGWVGIDEKGGSFRSYRVKGRPDGFLIGKDGSLLANLSPESLTEKDVREALAGTFKPRARESVETDAAPPAKAAATYFEAVISSSTGKGSGMSVGRGGLEARGMPFAFAVSWIWGVMGSQVIAEDPPVAKFDFRLKTTPDGFDEGRQMLKAAVKSAFGVDVAPESIEKDVLLLERAKGAAEPPAGGEDLKSGAMASGNGRFLGRTGTGELARGLWMDLGTPVVDETGLKGEYMFDLEWEHGDRAALDRVLAGAGFVLKPGRRRIEYLRVTRRAKAAKP